MKNQLEGTQSISCEALHIKEILCSANNKAIIVCANQKCLKSAFICTNQTCQCQKQHKKCFKVLVSGIAETIRSKIISMRSFSKMIEDKLQEFIDSISEFKNAILNTLSTQFQYHGVSKLEKQILIKLQTGMVEGISSQMIWNAIVKMKAISQASHSTAVLEKKIQNQLEERIRASVSSFQQIQKDIQGLIQHKEPLFQSSKVIKSYEEFNSIMKFFTDKRISQSSLLYRATDKQFLTQGFQMGCSNIPDTLVVLENQFGKKLGAYSPLAWHQQCPYKNLQDQSMSSFIFSLNNKAKFTLRQKKNAVICHNDINWGPDYGIGRDLIISNKANENRNSRMKLNSTYFNDMYSMDDKDDCFTLFGSQSITFKIKEWQVWKLNFEEPVNQENVGNR